MSRPGRAFVFSREYPPNTVGGTSTVARNLGVGLTALGWQVVVVSTVADPTRDVREEVDGVTVHRAATGVVYNEESGLGDQSVRTHRRLFTAAEALAAELGPPDLVLLPDLFCHPEARMFARRLDVPLVNILLQDFRAITPYDRDAHHVTTGVSAEPRHLLHLEEKAVTDCDHTAFISQALSDAITGYYPGSAAPHSVVHLGIDLAEIDAVRAEPVGRRLRAELLPGRPDTALLVACGRLVPVKGFAELLRALPDVHAPGAAPHLALVGVGPEEAALRGLAGELGVADRVTFLGDVPRRAALSWMSVADVAVVPSRWESFCYVCAELMAFARPVVCTAVDSLRELVPDARFGWPVPVAGPSGARVVDPGALAVALGAALADPAEGARRGAAARDRVERRFTNEHFAEGIAGIAGRLLERKSRA
ncbi:glycosyltransferase family 4 protein [Micromonospora sp. NPDC092111]|uniref:glycosyltransferase family 4 protein n=1 Tax=Micromonospora sp. NPDC092111 TaxID=3364289 RepID=UPI0038041FE8